MTSEPWPLLTLEEAGIRLYDCVHDTPKVSEFGYPWISIPEMKNGFLDFSSARTISEDDFAKWTKGILPQKNDVVISRRTNPGVYAPVLDDTPFALGQNLVILRSDGTKVLPEFLRILIASFHWENQVYSFINTGAVFESLTCYDIQKKMRFPIPKKSIQRRLIEILNPIDELVRIQKPILENLHDSISSIFRSWFIDFNPVRAKIEGDLSYSMQEEISRLFPDSFIDSELGPIPAGWKIGKLSDIAKITMGTSPPGDTYCDLEIATLPLLNGAGDFNGSVLAPKQGTTQPTKIANNGDFVFCIRATIGNLSVCEEQYCIGRGVSSAREKNWFDRGFLHQTISHLFRVWEWEATGSVIKGITGPEVKNSPVILPPEPIRKLFENTIRESMLKNQKCITLEKSLTASREALLSTLMSGKLEVN